MDYGLVFKIIYLIIGLYYATTSLKIGFNDEKYKEVSTIPIIIASVLMFFLWLPIVILNLYSHFTNKLDEDGEDEL